MYLTYAEYQAMGGTLDNTTFDDLEFQAEAEINWYTFNRLKNDTHFPAELKRLVKYLVNLFYIKNDVLNSSSNANTQGASSNIASQSNDGVSISYNVLNASEIAESCKQEIGDAITKQLQGVMNEAGHLLLYRGVYPNEQR